MNIRRRKLKGRHRFITKQKLEQQKAEIKDKKDFQKSVFRESIKKTVPAVLSTIAVWGIKKLLK